MLIEFYDLKEYEAAKAAKGDRSWKAIILEALKVSNNGTGTGKGDPASPADPPKAENTAAPNGVTLGGTSPSTNHKWLAVLSPKQLKQVELLMKYGRLIVE